MIRNVHEYTANSMKLLTAIRLRSCKHSFLPTGQSLGFSRLLSTARECNVEALHGNDKGIFVLTLDRPAAKNALGRTLLSQFRQSINDLRFNDQARVVIVKSAVDGVFCAGADLKSLPMPTIAVVDGFALGGGLELALCTDLRVGGQKAKVGLPETKLAIIPGAGGTQRLCRLIGVSRAKELIFTSRVLTSSEAFDYGIVNYTVNESAYSKALEVARTMIPNGPVAMRMAKLAVHHGSQLDLASGLAFEQTCYAQVIPTQDRLEGLAAFREKRTPVYTGR
ncbi:hypothetical protein QVD99_001275 [Batrachochytrium dendrobatidis]|nr:hypothetical protein QVD99_001275 [Batrachochytrium dendrobatidis]